MTHRTIDPLWRESGDEHLYGVDGNLLRTGLSGRQKRALERALDNVQTCVASLIINFAYLDANPDLIPERRKREERKRYRRRLEARRDALKAAGQWPPRLPQR
jgi:hypothetical protein